MHGCSSLGFPPPLSYGQLFSFQVAFINLPGAARDRSCGLDAVIRRKRPDWQRAILGIDFTMQILFFQEEERIFLSHPFKSLKTCVSSKDKEDLTLYVSFSYDEWELMPQNGGERDCIFYLFECINKDLSVEYAVQNGRGIIGLERKILKHGVLVHKSKSKQEQVFLVIVPGKLLMFKSADIVGHHVHFVTSLYGANVRMSYLQLEFQIISHGSREVTFAAQFVDEMTSWVAALERSIQHVEETMICHLSPSMPTEYGQVELNGMSSATRHAHDYGNGPEDTNELDLHPDMARLKKQCFKSDDESASLPSNFGEVSESQKRLYDAIGDMTNVIGTLGRQGLRGGWNEIIPPIVRNGVQAGAHCPDVRRPAQTLSDDDRAINRSEFAPESSKVVVDQRTVPQSKDVDNACLPTRTQKQDCKTQDLSGNTAFSASNPYGNYRITCMSSQGTEGLQIPQTSYDVVYNEDKMLDGRNSYKVGPDTSYADAVAHPTNVGKGYPRVTQRESLSGVQIPAPEYYGTPYGTSPLKEHVKDNRSMPANVNEQLLANHHFKYGH